LDAQVAIENTVAIGDGANDLDMMALAGLSIAFNAKPVVIEAADLSITEPTLSSVPQLMGL
jgi:phosphoserine phosphatase